MRANKLFKRQKAEKGSGRTVKVKHLLLPAEVVEDLRTFQLSYEKCFNLKRVTYEQIIRRWMDNISRIDPDVAKAFPIIKEQQRQEQERLAAGLGLTAEQLKANEESFDPTDPEIEPWKVSYSFEKDGKQVEALPGTYTPFYAKINGRNVGMKDMLVDGWILMNEVGVELDFDQAVKICALIKEHSEK